MSTTRHAYPLFDAVVGLVDVAIWDLTGKALDTSVAILIGGERSSMPTYRTGSHWNRRPADTFDEVQQVRARGHYGYKLTLGHGLVQDASFLHAARSTGTGSTITRLRCLIPARANPGEPAASRSPASRPFAIRSSSSRVAARPGRRAR
jgi:hypothetical protein